MTGIRNITERKSQGYKRKIHIASHHIITDKLWFHILSLIIFNFYSTNGNMPKFIYIKDTECLATLKI